MRGKRTLFDATTSRVKRVQTLGIELKPSLTLSDQGSNYFGKITDSRQRETWTQNDIHLATQLAVVQTEIDNCQALLNRDGLVILDRHGCQKPAPALAIQSTLFTIQSGLIKLLGLGASTRGLSDNRQRERNRKEREEGLSVKSADESDGILA